MVNALWTKPSNFFPLKEAPVFTELSRENDEEKGNFTFFFFLFNVDAFVLVLLKAGNMLGAGRVTCLDCIAPRIK